MTYSYFQDEISNFRFKLPAILYNSPLNIARGKKDDVQDSETNHNLNDDVIMFDDMDDVSFLLSGTIIWTNKTDLLPALCANIHLMANGEPLE